MTPETTPAEIKLEPLTAAAFAPFGDILEATGEPDMMINAGMCGRFHDLASLQCEGAGSRLGVSIFRSEPRALPYHFDLMERHPLGSQAFMPMTADPFMVIVAEDADGMPGTPRAFLSRPLQGVNYHRNVWHGVLAPLVENAEFIVIDRIGGGTNLDEHRFGEGFVVIP